MCTAGKKEAYEESWIIYEFALCGIEKSLSSSISDQIFLLFNLRSTKLFRIEENTFLFTNLKYTAYIFCEHKSHWYNLLAENDYSASQDLHLFLFAVRKLRRWLLFPPQDDLDFSLSSRYISANKLFVTPYVHIAEKSA